MGRTQMKQKIYNVKMDPKLKREWVVALRSGDYKQGAGALRIVEHPNTNRYRYCCLGVLCDIQGRRWYKGGGSDYGVSYDGFIDFGGSEDARIREALGGEANELMVGEDEGYHDVVTDLSHMNDNGCTFEEIADYIEQNL
jgi:hypothetical protein